MGDGAITGTLKFVDTGALPDVWGEGNFLALKFTPSASDTGNLRYRVGLEPSVSSGPVFLDEDMDAVFKITDKDEQILVVETVSRERTTRQEYDLSGLTLNTE